MKLKNLEKIKSHPGVVRTMAINRPGGFQQELLAAGSRSGQMFDVLYQVIRHGKIPFHKVQRIGTAIQSKQKVDSLCIRFATIRDGDDSDATTSG